MPFWTHRRTVRHARNQRPMAWLAALVLAMTIIWTLVGAAVLADESDGPKLAVTTGPDAVDDFYDHVTEDAAATLDVMHNDEPDPQHGIVLSSCTQPTPYGSTRISNQKIIFTPANASETYTATFEYTVDGTPDLDTATVTVVVAADDDPLDLVDHTEAMQENTWFNGSARDWLNPNELDEELFFGIADPEGRETWWLWEDGTISYRADGSHEPYTDTYTIVVTGTAGVTDSAQLSFVVSATNEMLYSYHYALETDEDGGHCYYYSPYSLDEKEPHAYTRIQAPEFGTTGLFEEGCKGWRYTPENRTESYTVTFAYAITDTYPSSAIITVTAAITADNDAPSIDDWLHYPWTTMPGHVISASVTVTDTDVDQPMPTVDLASGPSWLKLQSFENGTAVFAGTPGLDDVGIVTFSLRAYDGLIYGEPVTHSFEVLPFHDTSYVDGTEGTDSFWYGAYPRGSSFRSIGFALDHTNAGGTIYVAPGVYSEAITVTKPITLSPYHEGGAGDRAVIDASASAEGVGVLISHSQVSLTGFDVINAEDAIRVLPGVEDVVIQWCNLMTDTWGVSAADATQEVDARNNYWGSPDGPSGEGSGSGAGVTAQVAYQPWCGAQILGQVLATVTGTGTIEAEDTAGISATVTTTLPVSLTLAQYSSNPQAPFLYEDDLFWDVQLLDATGVDEMVVRFYIDEDQQEGKQQWNTRIMWWDVSASAWVTCSHQAWFRDPQSWRRPYRGIDVTFGPDTVPSLSQLTGTEFGVQAVPELWPLGLSMQRTGGPARFAPGWNLRFEMVISNTAPITLHHVVITDIVPIRMHNMYEITGDLGQPVTQTVYTCDYHVYRVGDMPPGQVLTQNWTYHTPSNTEDGTGFLYEAIGTSFESDWGFVGMGLWCDHSLLQPTPAPTPVGCVALPMVTK